jgi:methylmalonyl-CoA carboxyltransferase large subunit
MTETIPAELQETLSEILSKMKDLADRVTRIEKVAAGKSATPAPLPQVATPMPASAPPIVEAGISDEEVVAISAAVAAYLGVRAHIRQIRVIHSHAWAQQGRVTVQASHRLSY